MRKYAGNAVNLWLLVNDDSKAHAVAEVNILSTKKSYNIDNTLNKCLIGTETAGYPISFSKEELIDFANDLLKLAEELEQKQSNFK